MKALITRSDADYKTAVNFQHTFYNFPVTINVSRYGHFDRKYILG
jgi:hypothetical protein